MTNPFITIWTTFHNLARKIGVRAWQIIALAIALTYFIWLFICIHQIQRSEILYHLQQEKGLTSEGSAKINIAINNGLLFDKDSIPESTIEIHYILDSTASSDLTAAITSPTTTSLMRDFYPDSVIAGFKHIFSTHYEEKMYRRNRRQRAMTQSPLHFEDSTMVFIMQSPTITSSRHSATIHRHQLAFNSVIIPLQYDDNEFNIVSNITSSELSYFPSILSPWDISQKSYRIQYKSDGVRLNGNTIGYTTHDRQRPTTPLTEFKVDFLGPVELLPMNPTPDVVSISGFEFTDSLKLQQIMQNGLEFHAKFPQTESLQSARIFFLTAFISLFFTLLCTLGYRIVRQQYKRIKKKGRPSAE